MFSHVMVGADDIEASKAFYDATFAAFEIAPGFVDASGRVIYATQTGIFMISKPIDGGPASCANGGTIGFVAGSPERADAWHAAGLAHGGSTCEDPPGPRDSQMGTLYLAYLRDPAGNKLCALHNMGG